MNMQKYASYKKAAKRIVRLLNEERELKKEAGFKDWLSRAWNYNYGPTADGGQKSFYNNDSNIKTLPEFSGALYEVDDPKQTRAPLVPFARWMPTFRRWGETFGDLYDDTARINEETRKLDEKRTWE